MMSVDTPRIDVPPPAWPGPEPARDLARVVLGSLAILGLLGMTVWILAPFIPSIIWAVMIVVATWPVMLRVQRALGGRRGLAAAVMALALLLAFVGPFLAAVGSLLSNAGAIKEFALGLPDRPLPPPPAFLASLPVVGPKLAAGWQETAVAGAPALLARAEPYLVLAGRWLVDQVGGFGAAAVQFLLTVVFCAIFYTTGERSADLVRRLGARLAGARGEGAVVLAAQAIRGVALGVVVTAIVQALLAGLGLWAVGIPFAPVLTVVTFVLCLAQLGPGLMLLPAAAWLYFGEASSARAGLLLLWSLPVIALDNVLRPFLIKKGADLPLLLIFTGVVGGLISLGLVGIFVGPVVLAVGHTLLLAWVSEPPFPAEAPAEGAAVR